MDCTLRANRIEYQLQQRKLGKEDRIVSPFLRFVGSFVGGWKMTPHGGPCVDGMEAVRIRIHACTRLMESLPYTNRTAVASSADMAGKGQ
jgi:hypothetical protein